MQYELENNQEDCPCLNHEDWCDLLSTTKVINNRKRSAIQIKKFASSNSSALFESNKYVRIPRKNKASTGVRFKQQEKKTPKQHSAYHYCIICKKAGMPEQNYMSHNYEDCFGNISDQKSIKDGLGGTMGSRDKAVKYYNKSERK